MDFGAGIGHNVGIFYHNFTVLWIFSWGYRVTVSITTIFQRTLCFNFNLTNLLYIKLIHSCVLTYRTTWRCCIYLSINTEFFSLLLYIHWNYFSCHNIISRHKFYGIQSRCKILDISIQYSGETVDILSGRANIGYSVNVLHKSLTFPFNILERLLMFSVVGPTFVTV